MMDEKTYIAIDLKSFYASVECRERGLDPLTTKLVVADRSRTSKTICLAVTPALKAYGLSGRSRLFEVEAKAREIKRQTGKELEYIVAVPRMALYIQYSTRIYNVYLHYFAPEDIHVYSIDEVLIDATSYLPFYNMSARELAIKVIHDVLAETGITATAGIAPNLFLCKAAMDIVAKHIPADSDGVRISELDVVEYRRQLWNHQPITDFWRVGKATAQRLEKYFIRTMGDVARMSLKNPRFLYDEFGIDAEILIDHAWGIEPVGMKEIKNYKSEAKSLGSGQVLHEPYSFEKAKIIVREMAELLALDLFRKKLVTGSITLYVGYDVGSLEVPGFDGEVVRDYYGRELPKPAHGSWSFGTETNSSRMIVEAFVSIFERVVNPRWLVRRVNITANGTKPVRARQPCLFDSVDKREGGLNQEKEDSLQKARLEIINRYGKNAILKGMNLEEGATTRDRNVQIGGHKA
ncbi:MAG: DNA methylase [Treponema sp.]|nr:DNA methylase [Treponema sp.]